MPDPAAAYASRSARASKKIDHNASSDRVMEGRLVNCLEMSEEKETRLEKLEPKERLLHLPVVYRMLEKRSTKIEKKSIFFEGEKETVIESEKEERVKRRLKVLNYDRGERMDTLRHGKELEKIEMRVEKMQIERERSCLDDRYNMIPAKAKDVVFETLSKSVIRTFRKKELVAGRM